MALLQFPYVAVAWQAGSGPEHGSVIVVTVFTDGRCGVGQRSSVQGERRSQERTALHCVDSLSRERPPGISTCRDGTELRGSTPRASRPCSDTSLVFLGPLGGTEPRSPEAEAPTCGWALLPTWAGRGPYRMQSSLC